MQNNTIAKQLLTLSHSLILILVLIFLTGCCNEEPLIMSFTFEELSPSATGSISHSDHSIRVSVPESTDLSKLTPTIQVGDPLCHTLYPPSGQDQDFSSPVYYEVKNEAGATKNYEVIIEFENIHCYSNDTTAIQWTTQSDMPVPAGWGACAVLDQKIYVIGGVTDDRNLTGILQVYDPVTDQWDLSKSNPLYSRFAQGASVVDGKIYAFGGALTYPGPVYDNIQLYDPVENSWKDHGNMPTARAAFATVAYDGKIYLMGGETNEPTGKAEILDLVEVYDPVDNSWETLAPMPEPRAYFSACVVDNKIYAIGGLYKLPFPGLTTIEEYDPVSDTWEEKTPLKTGRYSLSTCEVNGKIFCIGGSELDHASPGSTTVEVYDPETDCVYPATDMGFIRYNSSSAVVDGKIYILGGCNDTEYYSYSNKTETGIPQFD